MAGAAWLLGRPARAPRPLWTGPTFPLLSGHGLSTRTVAIAAASGAVSGAAAPARPFVFVPSGQQWPASNGPALSCDGLVPGSPTDAHILHLSHWNENRTPRAYYGDTSTEIALNFVEAVRGGEDAEAARWGVRLPGVDGGAEGLIGAVVSDPAAVATAINNHYDTDGLLCVFTLQYPELALSLRDLLVQAAEAGDFEEWPATDEGLKLQFALEGRTGHFLSKWKGRGDESPDGWFYSQALPEAFFRACLNGRHRKEVNSRRAGCGPAPGHRHHH